MLLLSLALARRLLDLEAAEEEEVEVLLVELGELYLVTLAEDVLVEEELEEVGTCLLGVEDVADVFPRPVAVVSP